jgi:hypothetical protein
MIFDAYLGEQRDLQWVTVTLSVIATLLVTWRISNAMTTRGWLSLEDAFVVAANLSTQSLGLKLCEGFRGLSYHLHGIAL